LPHEDSATCDNADFSKSDANANSTGPYRLASKRAHPEARPLAMPRAAPTCTTTSAKAPVAERDPPSIPAGREINPDGHNRPIWWLNGSSGRSARDKQVGVRPRKPHPVNHHLSKVDTIRHHKSLPRGRLSRWDQHRCCNTVVLQLSPYPAHHPIGAVYSSNIPDPIVSECLHSAGPPSPVQGI
jgi:hypothetical protein